MAGDWIKMRVSLTTHPKVLCLAELLVDSPDYQEWAGIDPSGIALLSDRSNVTPERHAALRVTRYVTVTALLRFWGYANEHSRNGKVAHVVRQDIDEVVGVPCFGDALSAIGWAEFDPIMGGLTLPDFEKHNTSFEVRTTSAADRQKRYRERQKVTNAVDVTRDVTVTPREEKRREDIEREVRATRLPSPFVLEEDWRSWAKAERPDLDLDTSAANFADYWQAKPGKDGLKLDWLKTWRMWIRKEHMRPADVARVTAPPQKPSSYLAEQAAHREAVEADRIARKQRETA